MFKTNVTASKSWVSTRNRKLLAALLASGAILSQASMAQELSLTTLPAKLEATPALAHAAMKPAASLPVLEKIETLEEMSAASAPAEIRALFAEGLPCQLHARGGDGSEVTELHPLFPASATAATPAAPAPAPLPKLTPTPKPVVQPLMSATAEDAPFVSEKIKALQTMVELMRAKEKAMQRRAYYEKKLGEFDAKVGKEE